MIDVGESVNVPLGQTNHMLSLIHYHHLTLWKECFSTFIIYNLDLICFTTYFNFLVQSAWLLILIKFDRVSRILKQSIQQQSHDL